MEKFMPLAVIFLPTFICVCFAYQFIVDLTGDPRSFTVPCKGYNTSLYDVFDMSLLNFDLLENGSIHVHGNTHVVVDLPQESVRAKLITYKKRNGKYASTIFNVDTLDLCKKIFAPNEIWSPLLASTPKHQKSCPIKLGQEMTFDFMSDNMIINSPDRTTEGSYKIMISSESVRAKQKACIEIYLDMYEV